ncbi:Transcriptional regulator NovG [Rubripirellula obstinata]|uniref:Transcriptional regulator NovG n=1 Tax=Rubripirellula obstinata TaxID=406547 RepID=A0A5B1CP33_9BACT|nr:hypothetical protein [Rubripirellula obstinata]KAA1261599.1 Transcriptional regulator NovG [Rubripirellula obstinata]
MAVQKSVLIDQIKFDPTTQCRDHTENSTVDEYATVWRDHGRRGSPFPVPVFFQEGDQFWVGDGWHRSLAAKQAGRTSIPAEVRPGSRLDAIKHALGANQQHGLRRSQADKRKAIETALREFPDWSNNAIAKAVGVSDSTVKAHRQDSVQAPNHEPENAQESSEPLRRVGADGKSYPASRPSSSSNGAASASAKGERRPEDPGKLARSAIRRMEASLIDASAGLTLLSDIEAIEPKLEDQYQACIQYQMSFLQFAEYMLGMTGGVPKPKPNDQTVGDTTLLFVDADGQPISNDDESEAA